jgi:hypothetical protein
VADYYLRKQPAGNGEFRHIYLQHGRVLDPSTSPGQQVQAASVAGRRIRSMPVVLRGMPGSSNVNVNGVFERQKNAGFFERKKAKRAAAVFS